MLDFLPPVLQYPVSFVAVLTVVVFVHELGHYLIARWAGVKVEVFSIGFGPELFGFTDGHGTRWKVSVLPLGGYVKMFGDREDAEAGEAPRPMTAHERSVSFFHKPVVRRMAIVVAGPAANYVFAAIVFAILFTSYGQQVSSTTIGTVVEGSAAARAGILPGDKIVSLNGQSVTRFDQIARTVEIGLNEPLAIDLVRDGQPMTLHAVPDVVVLTDNFGNQHSAGRLGIGSDGTAEVIHYGPVQAAGAALRETANATSNILKAVWQMIVGTRSSGELGGILRIGKMSGDVAKLGFPAWVTFTAVLSINLGLINLFPVPMLDGGHLVFYMAEAARGRRLSARAEEWGLRIGLAMVLTLFVFATWNDLVSLEIFKHFRTLIG
ncbi:MAG TPA: RIP metalloprotease RseP [Hypericibacter adhaerens]|jgi:regulator of sigma E protease|uniref:Zinc metalloprotease n=1 Tax=Hypericibacter adhaerens TaxID=2602016 RepID=A0A5J6N069_9PROT|nr:RIP metalloprotease RseP [Hypericibacter adhaerens]QEX22335.1 zinc metalloprotease [Hypericibacter adhaerens]HWA46025.1 RIP metalloprotease RseP [Hypericibacter adhaerens]